MKRAWLWLTAGFLLFSVSGGLARPTQAQLDSLEALLAPLSPPVSRPDTINYDSVGIPGPRARTGRAYFDTTDYWMAVKFVPTKAFFSLDVVYYQVDNSLINSVAGCSVLVAKDDSGGAKPGSILYRDTIPRPLTSVLRSFELDSVLSFNKNVPFWILLGPAPGGPDPNVADIGDGWWGFGSDHQPGDLPQSYIRFKNDNFWTQENQINWVIRAGGAYSPPPEVVINEVMFNADPFSTDSSRNHEWVELFNHEKAQTTNKWQLKRGLSDPSPISIRDGIGFPSNTYLVVHISDRDSVDDSFGDGRGDIYVRRTVPFFNDRAGQCILFVPDALPPTADVVGWNLNNLSFSPDSINGPGSSDLIRVQPESALGPLLTATSSISFGRDSSGCGTVSCRTGKLVDFLGGPDAAGPTMGRKNFLPMAIDTSVIDSTPFPGADWTLMLYFAADNGVGTNSLERWCYDILNQVEDTIPASAGEVNVAVWFDSRNVYPNDNVSNRGTVFQGILRRGRDGTDMVKNLLPVGELNSGDSTTLKDFIRWAKTRFPANRYALALKGDGAGWEGLCGDASSLDRIEMGELKTALAGGLGTDSLDLLILDAPLMSQLEVATQVKDFAHFMVASPEMTGPADFDYARLVGRLNSQPSISNADLAGFLVDTVLDERLKLDPLAIWTAIRLDGLNPLLDSADALARHLETGVRDVCASGNFTDNYQLKIRASLTKVSTDHYGTQGQGMADFVDLRQLAASLKEPVSSPCNSENNKAAADVYNFLTDGGSIIAARAGGGTKQLRTHEFAGGLSIYFPSSRQKDIPIAKKNFRSQLPYTSRSDHPFDSTGLETEGGVSQGRRIYAADLTACYPHAGTTCSTSDPSRARNHPFQPVSDFDFVDYYHWDEFLIRYYKPAADAGPSVVDKRLNELFSLSASGTSDADDDTSHLSFYWDLDPIDKSTSCSDYRFDDLDKDCDDNGVDDRDSTGRTVSFKYLASGPHFIWLHVWDPTDDNLEDSLRRFQTSKDSVKIQVQFRGIQFVWEDASITGAYTGAFPPVGYEPLDATDPATRVTLPEDTLTDYVNLPFLNKPHVVWATGNASPPLFPDSCQRAINKTLTHDDMGVLVFGPEVAGDAQARAYFDSYGFAIDSTPGQSANFIEPDVTYPQHFLSELGVLPLSPPGVQLRSLVKDSLDTCIVFPILKTDAGKIVAAARVTDSGKHAIVYFAFDLGRLDRPSDRIALLEKTLGWLAFPVPPQDMPVCCVKGDVDQNGTPSAGDVVKLINCAFVQTEICLYCAADLNCDGQLTGSDVLILIAMLFNTGTPQCP